MGQGPVGGATRRTVINGGVNGGCGEAPRKQRQVFETGAL